MKQEIKHLIGWEWGGVHYLRFTDGQGNKCFGFQFILFWLVISIAWNNINELK